MEKPAFDTYFSDPALVKAFYHPSSQLHLSSKLQQEMILSPQRVPEKESGEMQQITPDTEAYLRQTEYVYSKEPIPDHPTPSPPDTAKFDESWPSTERPSNSSIKKNTSDTKETDNSADSFQVEEPGVYKPSNSILSQYIRRFRLDPPKSRQERNIPSLNHFWWGSQDSRDSETGKLVNKDFDDGSNQATNNTTSDRDFSLLSTVTPTSTSSSKKGKRITFESTTPKTKALIDKANTLLSISSTDEIGPVSSEGVGSSSISSSGGPYHSTPEEVAVRPILHRVSGKDDSHDGRVNFAETRKVNYRHQQADSSEDILQQWRLKRRKEQAKEKVQTAEMAAKWSSWNSDRVKRKMAVHVVNPEVNSSSIYQQRYYEAQQRDSRPERVYSSAASSAVVPKNVQTDPETAQATTQTTEPVDACATSTNMEACCTGHAQQPITQHLCSPSKLCSCCGQVTLNKLIASPLQPPCPPVEERMPTSCTCRNTCGRQEANQCIVHSVHHSKMSCKQSACTCCSHNDMERCGSLQPTSCNDMRNSIQEAAHRAALNNVFSSCHLPFSKHGGCCCTQSCTSSASHTPSKSCTHSENVCRSLSPVQHCSQNRVQTNQNSPRKARVRLQFRSTDRHSSSPPLAIKTSHSPVRKAKQTDKKMSSSRTSRRNNEILAKAISQVMSDQLFVDPKKSSRTDPKTSKVNQTENSLHRGKRITLEAPDNSESDGEFPNDEILQVLRQKRDNLISKIRAVDEKIAVASSCSEQS